ncbi:unnamed protein product, partial [Musa hybrid cultivar]
SNCVSLAAQQTMVISSVGRRHLKTSFLGALHLHEPETYKAKERQHTVHNKASYHSLMLLQTTVRAVLQWHGGRFESIHLFFFVNGVQHTRSLVLHNWDDLRRRHLRHKLDAIALHHLRIKQGRDRSLRSLLLAQKREREREREYPKEGGGL